MKKLDNMTYEELKQQLVNNQVIRITNSVLVALETGRPFLKSETLVIEAKEDNHEADIYIEGFIKRIPKDLAF